MSSLVLVAILSLGANAGPVSLESRQIPCTLPCPFTYQCKIVNGKPACVPQTKCGQVICPSGQTCCNASCGICAPPGVLCAHIVACKPTPQECGPATCVGGYVCCDPICGVCTPPGAGCARGLCLPYDEICGPRRCAPGEVCCNESCGICTLPEVQCTQQVCST
jgi:hypothetical protein